MSKEEKYDRQLRLWQSSGQSNLENSNILIISPNLSSLELIKNLILPGLGSFTILDSKDNLIQDIDLSNNFYINEEDLGKPKAKIFAQNLNEFNHDVKHDIILINENFQEFWNNEDSINSIKWESYNYIVSNWQYPELIKLSESKDISLIILNSISYFGFLRIFQKQIKVIETHNEKLLDLRLLDPFPELLKYSNDIDLHNLELETHSQIPYLIIQLKALQEYQLQNNGLTPKSYKEKQEYKKIIQNWKKSYDELNFDEALTNSNKIFNYEKIPQGIIELFNKIDENFKTNDKFWLLVKSLKKFTINNDGYLPITGEIPDMDSTTNNYMILKKIYRDKFDQDLKKFQEILFELNVENLLFKKDELTTFIKNAKYLYFSQLSYSFINNVSSFIENFGPELNSFNSIILSFIIIENYYLQFNQLPTLSNFDTLLKITLLFLQNKIKITDDYKAVLYEFIRGNSLELSNISSIIGGIGSQELLKLITKQYKPLDDFLVWDGLKSVSERFKIKS
ncbi:hypothetical protein WICMUC_001090 [Wickerhamomyces mucosus]|uniref:NEDD8-activating enzyme E1 regulatory subunit n=1 Tax=Wickerhamomyces mucosus TaxID=1378264 RepID=A0A9P8PXG9_9ASCO|nr:hypothetical protein WICMUC_001090 [Wickerhamomyces mucosus]